MDKSAIEQIQATALAAAGELQERLPMHATALPKTFDIHDIERFLPGRTRYRGRFCTNSLADFVSHVKENSGGQGFIDGENMTATVFFNLGTVAKPGHGDWRALLGLEKTPAYASVRGIDGNAMTQQQVIDWLEDWDHLVAAWKDDEDGVQEIRLAKAVTALRRVKIEARSATETQQENFRAAQSRLDSVEASSDEGLPDLFTFTTEPYLGLQARTIRLRLSVMTGGDKPKLRFRIVGIDQLVEEISQEFKARLLNEVGDAATMLIGEFQP